MSPGLTYLVVRCHSMMAELLSPAELRSLAEAESLEELMVKLDETPYAEFLRGVERRATALEGAYHRAFIERVGRVIDLAPGRMAPFLGDYYYMRMELLNLRRVMRGLYAGIPPERIAGELLPLPPYRGPDPQLLLKAGDVEGAFKGLEGNIYHPPPEAVRLYEELEALWPLEQALINTYIGRVYESMEALRGDERAVASRVVGVALDVENLLAAVKRRGDYRAGRLPALEALWPHTYRVGLETLRAVLEARRVGEALDKLPQPYRGFLEPLLEGDVAGVRANLNRHLYRMMWGERAKNDYGFNAVLAYLLFSEMEKEDLVRITWSIMQGLKHEDILKYLVVALPAA
ncbi:MAG: H(+)-transporting two-sector ATPase [Candidatus Bathyarchaeota archaeon B23]|nr:MAG: H(+)-transporting two-sector ATPase [Candidatus Bathyarchaeota archaeon B23]